MEAKYITKESYKSKINHNDGIILKTKKINDHCHKMCLLYSELYSEGAVVEDIIEERLEEETFEDLDA